MTDEASELKGRIKQAYGKLTKNAELESEGSSEAAEAQAVRNLEGMLDQAVGTVESYVGATVAAPLLTAKGEARRIRGSVKRTK